ncbi:class I SAM-dependent methyltransferase [Hydrogenophaga sp. OTU3427]|uniref:class I SAM-dependent methyltransferase n=1 Tax=Hydrogenophaga sp. OTU3427 TaxID=3043856 RepID=UPI00313CB38D
MSEVRSGVRHLLAMPMLYNLFQDLVGANTWRRAVVNRALTPVLKDARRGARVLDIGCGPAEVLSYLPPHVDYVGFDRNPAYIASAQERYRDRQARFVCDELTVDYDSQESGFDVILALGLLHHLDDATAESLFRAARQRLKPGGFLLTLDPLYAPEQSGVARYIISKDRGTHVRTENGYRGLAGRVFDQVVCQIDHHPLRIPYTGIVMSCAV